MSKVIILGDTHYGIKSGSSFFANYQISFFNDQLFPYMVKNGINTIFQLGDLFDHRTSLNLKMYHAIKEGIFESIVRHKFKMHVLVGNHDATLRESITINSVENLLGGYIESGVIIPYSKASTVKVGSTVFDIIPWICNENRNEIHKFISRPKIGDILLGHLEIQGAEMQKGVPGHGGLPLETFDRYSHVLSGHYHTRSFLNGKKINYVGTPYELNFGDSEDPRGFTIYDTETKEFDFVENTNPIFIKLKYNDGCSVNIPSLEGKLIRLYVHKKTNQIKFDNFIGMLKAVNPQDLSIIENMESVSGVKIDESIEIEDTHQIISTYIDNLETNLDKTKIKKYISELFLEAVNT